MSFQGELTPQTASRELLPLQHVAGANGGVGLQGRDPRLLHAQQAELACQSGDARVGVLQLGLRNEVA